MVAAQRGVVGGVAERARDLPQVAQVRQQQLKALRVVERARRKRALDARVFGEERRGVGEPALRAGVGDA